MISNQSSCDAVDNAYDAGLREKPDRDLIVYVKSIDRTWLLIGLIFLAIAIGLPSHLLESVRFTVENLWSIAPFLLLSATLAGYLEAASADRLIGRVFSERVVLAIVSAAVFGALSPFCSCGGYSFDCGIVGSRCSAGGGDGILGGLTDHVSVHVRGHCSRSRRGVCRREDVLGHRCWTVCWRINVAFAADGRIQEPFTVLAGFVLRRRQSRAKVQECRDGVAGLATSGAY